MRDESDNRRLGRAPFSDTARAAPVGAGPN